MRGRFCRWAVWLTLLGALAVLLSACQGEKGEQPQPAQGTVRLHGTLPAGGPVKTTEESSDNPAPARPETLHPVGTAVKFDLEGRQLSEPITLGLAFDANSLPKGTPRDAVFLSSYDEAVGEWVPAGGKVDPESDVVQVQTDHLSWWQPTTWNWDAWIAVLKKTLSGSVTQWVEAAQLLTEECVRSGDTVSVDESGANNVIQGCITKDDPSSPELRVVNLKSFYLGISPGPGGPGYPPAAVLSPGEAAQFTADTSDLSPVVYADFTEEAMWRFVVGLAARMVPGGDLVPNEGLAFIADGLQKVLSAQQISKDLDAGTLGALPRASIN